MRIGILVALLLALCAPGASASPIVVPADGSIVTVPVERGVWRVVMRGVYDYDTVREGAQLADAECSTPSPLVDDVTSFSWQRTRYGLSVDPAGSGPVWFGDDVLDVLVDGVRREWVPAGRSQAGCDDEHTYSVTVRGGPLTLRINDVEYADNAGSLEAWVTRV